MCIGDYAPEKFFKVTEKNSVTIYVEIENYLSSKKIFLKEKSLQTTIKLQK